MLLLIASHSFITFSMIRLFFFIFSAMGDDKQSEMTPTNSTLRHAGKQTINTFPSTLNNSTRSTRNDIFRYSSHTLLRNLKSFWS